MRRLFGLVILTTMLFASCTDSASFGEEEQHKVDLTGHWECVRVETRTASKAEEKMQQQLNRSLIDGLSVDITSSVMKMNYPGGTSIEYKIDVRDDTVFTDRTDKFGFEKNENELKLSSGQGVFVFKKSEK